MSKYTFRESAPLVIGAVLCFAGTNLGPGQTSNVYKTNQT